VISYNERVKESEEGSGRACWILKAAKLIRAKMGCVQYALKARYAAVDITLTTDNGTLLGVGLKHDLAEQRTSDGGVNKHQAQQHS
jgi:hypothetical protein